MRVTRVSELKGKRATPVQEAPRVGTRLRILYDLLLSGSEVQSHCFPYFATMKDQLELFYGLEIVPGHKRGRWRLR